MAYREQIESSDFWASLQEYDSFNDAIADLGENQPFLASLANSEGWRWRQLFVTPETEVALESCIYNDDLNTYYDVVTVESLIVDGIEYVPVPQALTSNPITIGIYTWDTRLADFINSLSIPNFYAEYPSEADMDAVDAIDHPGDNDPKPRNCIRLVMEPDIEFTLIQSSVAGGWARLTKTNSESGSEDNYVVDADDDFYLFHAFGCIEV